ncbi:MAG: OsmC family protein [Rhodospirillales bacterium]
MKVAVKWKGGRVFEGAAAGGHKVVMAGAPGAGERDEGVRPMEMLLLGLGGCASYDVVHILEKGRQKVTACEVGVEAERAGQDPKVFTRIHLTFRIRGENLDEAKAGRAVSLSAEKYCSASVMLARTAEITHQVIVEEG